MIFQSCTKDDEQEENPTINQSYTQGEIIRSQSLGSYSPKEILQIFTANNVTIPFALDHSVDVLSIEYSTIDKEGAPIRASGAFCIPNGIDDLPLLSIQHGTETKSDRVASVSTK